MNIADRIETALSELYTVNEGDVTAGAWENIEIARAHLGSALSDVPRILGLVEHVKDGIGVEADAGGERVLFPRRIVVCDNCKTGGERTVENGGGE